MVTLTALLIHYRGLLCNKMLLAWCLLSLTLISGHSTAAGGAEIVADVVSMQAEVVNRPPIARAGADRTVKIKTKVVLDGSKSRDPDGRIVKYAWRQVLGQKVVLHGKITAKPYFMTPSVKKENKLKFALTVTDNKGATAKDTVIITVVPNKLPVAEAGDAQSVNEAATVKLSGSGTDSDGRIVSYAWAQIAGQGVSLTNTNIQTPSFVAPAITNASGSKVLTFRLTVTDNKGGKGSDTVSITVNAVNENPTADAGTDQDVDENSSVSLSGSGSDPDGDTLTYSWAQTDSSGFDVTLTDEDTATPDFTAPAVTADTTLNFTLTVDDGYGGTATDTVGVLVKDAPVVPTPTGKLNDTGITLCGDYALTAAGYLIEGHTFSNSEDCSLFADAEGDLIPPIQRAVGTGQDGYVGRDVAPVTNDDSDGLKGFSFTKISSSGYELPASAADWSCIKDNVTGLIWEVKTDDGGLHDKDNLYTWYEPDSSKNGGFAGYQKPSDYNAGNIDAICYGYTNADAATYCNTHAYVNRVNAAGWCGANDWRMPTTEELRSIVSYHPSYSRAIDTTWFPNTPSLWSWTASPYADNVYWAWVIGFADGRGSWGGKDYNYQVRLVRSGQ